MSNMTAEVPREKLKELMERNGDSLLQDPDRCEGLLKDHCGSHRREISALVGALEERIPLELKSSWQTAMTPEAMRARLVQRLEDNRGLAPDVANWAVDAWSYALGVGLARRSDRVEGAGGAAAGVAGAGLAGAGIAGAGVAGATLGAAFAADSGLSLADRVASDRPGGAAVAGAATNATKAPLLAQMATPKRAGMGIAAALLLGVGAFAIINHHPGPAPVPPAPAPAPGPAVVTPKPAPGGEITKTEPRKDAPKFLPAGTSVAVRLDSELNSDNLNEGDVVNATVSSPITVDGNVIVATGAKAKLKVTAVDHTAQDGGAEHLRLALVDLATEQGRVNVTTTARQFNGPTLHMDQAKRGGIGAAAGAVGGFVVGKLFHHGGAGAGAGAAGGAVAGVVTAKAGPVKMAAETPLQFRIAASVRAPSTSMAKR